MIKEINKDNLFLLKDSFLKEETVKEEISNNPFAHFIVLIEDDKIIGYLYYSDIYDRVEINQFEIETIHRNCGKGQILLTYLIKTVDKDITLEVKKDNSPALHLYQKNGFRETAIRKNYYQGIDGILMERKRTKAL